MRNIWKEYLKHIEAKEQAYINWNNKYKQTYWDEIFCAWLFPLNSIDFPVNLSEYKKKIQHMESDFERFIPGIIEAMSETALYEINIEDVFILDEQSKKSLDLVSSVKENSTQIIKATNWNEWLSIQNEELAEKIWDLFYDSLSSFISSLWGKIDNTEIAELLKEASNHIIEAWKICLPYVSYDFPEMKHTSEVKWLDIDKEELVKRISNLVSSELSDFLLKLSVKIKKDWEADKWRNRIKLSNELFACADNLKQASDLLK